ncbi:MAG: benzoate/H(+) symporter BenE family transporter [Burkholderiaceae bacterium]
MAAGFVAVLIGFASSAVIVFQAAAAAGATPAQVGSWILALCVGMAVTSIIPSLIYRQPILTAWSTPGAALLAVGLNGVPMSDAIGAFIVCGLMITVCGLTGWFERAMSRIPIAIASALLAGVLFRFGADVFVAARTQRWLVLAMFVAYLVFKRWLPRYAVIGVLGVGVAVAAAGGLLHVESLSIALARPQFVMPTFSVPVLISVSVPLFIVTMASQNLPGVAVMRAAGYPTPVSALLVWTGVATVVLAPFGAYALNLAAITAAICMGKEAHDDPARRHRASIAAGVFYLLAGLFGATVVGLFSAFPKELIMALAGLALLATIGNGLQAAMQDERQREPALITFLVTASGVSLLGIGAAFWGLVAGAVAMGVWRRR